MIMIVLQLEINFINVVYCQVFVKYWKPILFRCSSHCDVWAIEILPEKRLCWRNRFLVVTATARSSRAGRDQAAIDTKATCAMSRAPPDQRLHPPPSLQLPADLLSDGYRKISTPDNEFKVDTYLNDNPRTCKLLYNLSKYFQTNTQSSLNKDVNVMHGKRTNIYCFIAFFLQVYAWPPRKECKLEVQNNSCQNLK